MDPNPTPSPESTPPKSWLDGLQQESWQLELLISGFSIFLLIGGWEWVKDLEYEMLLRQQGADSFLEISALYYVMRTAYATLIACLLFHVLLRGVWIAAIGLRSISGDIDYDNLRYQDRFNRFLHRRMGSFDDYLTRLERYCSVLFSVAFLLLFCFLSLASYSVVFNAVTYVLTEIFGEGTYDEPLTEIVQLLMTVLGLIYFFDFATLGLLKRSKWLAKPYFFLYRFMGWLSLARLYRPLYHNLIDNRFGRKLAVVLPVMIAAILVIVSFKQVDETYIPSRITNSTQWNYHNFYDDQAISLRYQMWNMSLASKYVRDDYVEAFLPYIPVNNDETLKMIDPDMVPANFTGPRLEGAFNIGQNHNPAADSDRLLAAFRELHHLYLNDSLLTIEPRFHRHPTRRQLGLLYMIPVHDLPPGEHRLRADTRMYMANETKYREGTTILFYQ